MKKNNTPPSQAEKKKENGMRQIDFKKKEQYKMRFLPFRAENSVFEKINRISKRDGVSITKIIYLIVTNYLSEYEKNT